jgi:exodeoxyribonuclease V alpha subunit
VHTQENPAFSPFDQALADFLCQRSGLDAGDRDRFKQWVLALSADCAKGHNCLDLTAADAEWLLQCRLVSDGRTVQPLVVSGQRLYLHRYWQYEQRLAEQLAARCQRQWPVLVNQALLDQLFPATAPQPDGQKQAALTALSQSVTLITGGPGTGKTTTVVKLLALLQAQASEALHIALAAPTGKAAMRLQESIIASKQTLPCDTALIDSLPHSVTTLHSLLGAQAPSPYFKHNATSPLPHDAVVVDETSMVDLALMSKLVDALKPNARLILLGDKEQLASVESGAVLADLSTAMSAQTVELLYSHRFQGDIKTLAEQVNQQQADSAWHTLHTAGACTTLLDGDAISFARQQYQAYWQLAATADASAISDLMEAFNRFRVLCSNQQGPQGVHAINQQLEHTLISPRHGQWYPGRPVLLTRNSPDLGLYNGDIGLCLRETDSHNLRVFFMRSNGSVQSVSPQQLLHCETAFAMTIHKSQGSEFDAVLIMLPEQANAVLSKSLLYTAITRAKQRVTLAATHAVFNACVNHAPQRTSGLSQRLSQLLSTPTL